MKKLIHDVVFCLLLFSFLTVAGRAAWLLRAQDGFLAVLDPERGETVFQSEIPVAALPGRDRRAAEAGLLLADRAALSRALEDFCS